GRSLRVDRQAEGRRRVHYRVPAGRRGAQAALSGGAAQTSASAMSYIDIADVSLTYPSQDGDGDAGDGTLALQELTLRVGRGECIAVVGPSGCGKSTLLKLVSGLHRQSSGRAAVDGRAIAGPLKIVGMAFQNPTLLPWRT